MAKQLKHFADGFHEGRWEKDLEDKDKKPGSGLKDKMLDAITKPAGSFFDKIIKFIKDNGPRKFEYNYDIEIHNEKTPIPWIEKKF